MTDPTFPDRPDHPDFWLLSQIMVAQDTVADQGGGVEDTVGRHIDLESLSYMASRQAAIALGRLHPDSPILPRRNVMALMAAGFMSGFLAGQTFQSRKDIDHQAAQLPWVIDYYRTGLLPGEPGDLVARFTTEEHATAFLHQVIATRDPDGLVRGEYGIVGPSDDEPPTGEKAS